MVKKINAIYSYKILDKFWKQRGEDFFKLAKVSVYFSKKYYNTVLYSDYNTKAIFDEKGILFDKYFTSDELFEEVNEHTYGLSKLFAMVDQKEPYVTLDLDTVIFEEISTKAAVTYGYKEINLASKTTFPIKMLHIDYVKEYYWEYHSFFESRVSDRELEFDWTCFPSNSLIYVNNPEIVREAILDMFTLVNRDYRKMTVQYYEQFLVYNLLKNYGTKIKFIYDYVPNPDLKKEISYKSLVRNKFLHLDAYYRDLAFQQAIGILYENLKEN
jgi:hypothetical protein